MYWGTLLLMSSRVTKEHENDPRIPEVCADMAKEMGEGKYYADLNVKMAQFELTLLDWVKAHKGSRKYVAIAGKCWPAFQTQFGFVPESFEQIQLGILLDLHAQIVQLLDWCVTS